MFNTAQKMIEEQNPNNSTETAILPMQCYVPLIFLDIDGVFNCQLFYQSKQFTDYKEAKKSLRKSLKAKEIERLDITKVKFAVNVLDGLMTCAKKSGQKW